MTLVPESSEDDERSSPYEAIESLAGLYHPHAIEVQDFTLYGLVIDLRSAVDYENDHIPGALRFDPPAAPTPPLSTGPHSGAVPPLEAREASMPELSGPLADAVAQCSWGEAILVYCGRGGLDSVPVAKALRWRGWTVDVLYGGWINYRRWVLAGLEVLPRLVRFRVLACTLGSETARVLAALRHVGHQVLDLEAMACARRFALTPQASGQPAQAWFDSQLLNALRYIDPKAVVWIADTGPMLGTITLPGALNDALAIAPAATLQADLAARASAWAQEEPLCADIQALLQAVSSLGPMPDAALTARWRDLATRGSSELLLSSLLSERLDPIYEEGRTGRKGRQHGLPALVVASLDIGTLHEAVRRWMPPPEEEPLAAT
jgi:tRNA 2-selenouridine synthase